MMSSATAGVVRKMEERHHGPKRLTTTGIVLYLEKTGRQRTSAPTTFCTLMVTGNFTRASKGGYVGEAAPNRRREEGFSLLAGTS